MELPAIAPYLIAREDYPIPMLTPEEQKAMLERLAEKNQKKVVEMAKPSKVITPGPDGKLKIENPISSVSQRVSVPYGPDREYADLRQKLEAATHGAIERQAGGIDQMEQTLQGIKQSPRQIDWSALASYFDSTVPGSKLSQGYKAPETEAERQARIAQLEGQIQKAKEGISDKEIDSMKALLNTHMYNKAIQASGRQDRFNEAQLYKKEKDIGADLEKDIFDPLNEDQKNFSIMEQNLMSGDSQKIMSTLSVFARQISGQKGVLTDKDIALVMPRNYQADIARIEAYLSSNPNAPLPKEYTAKMKEMIDTARTAAAEAYGNKVDQKREAYASRRSFSDVFSNSGSGHQLFDQARRTVDKFKTVAPQGSADPKARLEELRKKYRPGG